MLIFSLTNLCYRFLKCLNKCKVRNFENVFIINDDSIRHANHNRLNKIILMHIAFMYRVTICTYQVCKVIPSFSHHQFIWITKSGNISVENKPHSGVSQPVIGNRHWKQWKLINIDVEKNMGWVRTSKNETHNDYDTYCTLECNIVGFAFNTT